MESYQTFVVRCWRDQGARKEQLPGWRFALLLISGSNTTTIGFANFDLLITFLASEILGQPSTDDPQRDMRIEPATGMEANSMVN